MMQVQVARKRKDHSDGARGDFSVEFPVHEVSPASPAVAERDGEKSEVEHLEERHLVAAYSDDSEDNRADEAAVVGHSRNSDEVEPEHGIVAERRDDFKRVREIVRGVVEADVAEACADEDAGDDPRREAVELFLGDADLFLAVHVPDQGVAGREGEQVHEAVPADGKAPELDRRAVEVRRNHVPPGEMHLQASSFYRKDVLSPNS